LSKYNGITTKTLKNGTKSIYVRFKHHGKNYGVKNFTKLFGCKTEKSAFDKLYEVKLSLSSGTNPFDNKSMILNHLWDKKLLIIDWRETTRNHYTNFYDIVIRNTLGKKPLNKITAKDVLSLKNQYIHKSISYQNRIKSLISPIMDEAVVNEELDYNPLSLIKNKVAPSAQSIKEKIIDNELEIAKKLYKKLKSNDVKYISNNYHRKYDTNEETNSFFILMLMTVHRFGELLKLKKSDIYGDKIVSPKEITKTNRSYEFPFPKELQQYVENKSKDELLFPNLNRGIVSVRFGKLINNLDIIVIKNQTVTPHDLRRIFTSILIKDKVDVSAIDNALEHSIRGVMSHYLHYSYEDKKEVFEKYWELIRE
jgi:integrase